MKVPAATIALCVFVIAAAACAPTADQEPATDETAATEADVEALKALEETVVAAFLAGEIVFELARGNGSKSGAAGLGAPSRPLFFLYGRCSPVRK